MTKNQKKVNYTKWGVIITALIGIPGAIATLVTFPELGCKVGLNTPACVVPQKDIEFVTQAETGEFLSGVTVDVIAAKGAPEVQYTDDRGYVKVNIPSKGNVRVTLIKKGYPTQDFNINLENSQDTIRVIKFSQSGQPNVQAVPSLPPSPIPSASASIVATPSPSSSASSGNSIQVDGDVAWELKQCVRKQPDVSCSFVLTTTNARRSYGFYLNNSTKMTDHQGYEYFSSKGAFVDIKGGVGSSVGHEVQSGSTYAVSVDFSKVPTSVNEVNSIILNTFTGGSMKFDNVSIK